MDQTSVIIAILGMTLVTYLPRLLPIWFLTTRSVPPVIISWLRYVPVAVLSAMLFPAVLVENKQIHLGFNNLFLWATIPTVIIAWKKRSLFGAVLFGMALVAAGRFLFTQ